MITDVRFNDNQIEVYDENSNDQCDAFSNVLTILAEFKHIFEQVFVVDPSFARQSGIQYLAFLNGPKNKPTKDCPLKEFIIAEFKQIIL